jgi:hypothetical protein
LEFAEARERIELQREQAELQRARAEDLARSVEAEKAAGAEKARTASQENYRKALREYQDKVKERRKASELREKAYQELLTQAKMHLIEAIANHGDSLTHVKPEEYINLVLTSGRGGGAMLIGELYGDTVEYASAGSRTGREIISVQKSYITDYKAGRLTLEGFKQKVLQYFD